MIEKAKHDKPKDQPRRNSRLTSWLSLPILLSPLVLAQLILRPSQTPPPITTVVVIQPTPIPPPLRLTATPRLSLSTGKIVYESDGDLYLVNADGSGKQRLTNSPLHDFGASWSPDGKSLAYWSQVESPNFPLNSQLHILNVTSGKDTILTPPELPQWEPLWSPDGRTLLLQVENEQNVRLLYLVDADGTHLKQLTSAASSNYYPAWSPDGKQIAFGSTRDDTSGYNDLYQIYLMNADGTNQRRLISDGNSVSPSWSPDGKLLVYSAEDNLYITDLVKPAPTLLVAGGDIPQWSPDGKHIAFGGFPSGGTRQVYVIDPDGSNKRQLTVEGTSVYVHWSPDSKWLITHDLGDNTVDYLISLETGEVTTFAVNNTESWTIPSWQPR